MAAYFDQIDLSGDTSLFEALLNRPSQYSQSSDGTAPASESQLALLNDVGKMPSELQGLTRDEASQVISESMPEFKVGWDTYMQF